MQYLVLVWDKDMAKGKGAWRLEYWTTALQDAVLAFNQNTQDYQEVKLVKVEILNEQLLA